MSKTQNEFNKALKISDILEPYIDKITNVVVTECLKENIKIDSLTFRGILSIVMGKININLEDKLRNQNDLEIFQEQQNHNQSINDAYGKEGQG